MFWKFFFYISTNYTSMKFSYSVIITLLIIVGCSSPSENEMVLTGHIDGLKKGTLVLQKVEDTLLVSIDSIVINGDANFTFSSEVKSPEVYFLALKKDGDLREERIEFFAESTPIHITSSLKNYGLDVKIVGSKNSDQMNDYGQLIRRYTNKNLSLIEDLIKANNEGKKGLADSLQAQQNRLIASKYLATVNFALNHKEYEVAPYLMLTEAYDVQRKYLDTVYNALTPKIKDSKYGRALESFISNRKE